MDEWTQRCASGKRTERQIDIKLRKGRRTDRGRRWANGGQPGTSKL